MSHIFSACYFSKFLHSHNLWNFDRYIHCGREVVAKDSNLFREVNFLRRKS